jgi:hypothetical protein
MPDRPRTWRLRRGRPGRSNSPYGLIIKGADDQPRLERFGDAHAYRARLTALQPSIASSVTIDELVDWLDSGHDGPLERKDRRPSARRVSSN